MKYSWDIHVENSNLAAVTSLFTPTFLGNLSSLCNRVYILYVSVDFFEYNVTYNKSTVSVFYYLVPTCLVIRHITIPSKTLVS